MNPQQQEPWYRSSSGSMGNRLFHGGLAAGGGALAGMGIAHELGRSKGKGALIGAAAGGVLGAVAGPAINRWANRNPQQYESLQNFTNKIAGHAQKTVLASYGLSKLAEPQTNAHKDVGTYRFNDTANQNEIEYDKQQVFKRVDRKPSHTGQESSHGTFYDEGVAG